MSRATRPPPGACSRASPSGRWPRWAWATTPSARCSCSWPARPPGPSRSPRRTTTRPRSGSGSATARSWTSRSRRRRCFRPAGRCARDAACPWILPVTPAPSPTVPARSSKPAPARDAHRTERLLATLPEVELLGVLRGASNYTFLARLRPHEKDGLLAVYKPERGESPLWDFPSGTLYRREVAAYELSKVLGWPRIPPTVVRRDGPHGVGAVQLLFDADDEVWVIDHGLTFHTDQKLRTVIWDFAGQPLPTDLCGDVERGLVQL